MSHEYEDALNFTYNLDEDGSGDIADTDDDDDEPLYGEDDDKDDLESIDGGEE